MDSLVNRGQVKFRSSLADHVAGRAFEVYTDNGCRSIKARRKGNTMEGRTRTIGAPLLTGIVIVCCAQLAMGGEILQALANITTRISGHGWLGQSFVAEDPLVSIGFWLADWDRSQGESITLSVDLFAGEGHDGAFLVTAPIDGLAAGHSGFAYADFSSVTLTVGQTYSGTISDPADRWAMRYWVSGGMTPTRPEEWSRSMRARSGGLTPSFTSFRFRSPPR